MVWLILFTTIIAIAAAVWLRPRQTANYPVVLPADTGISPATASTASLLNGMMLSYLVSNFLIDSQQYETWRSLTADELKTALGDAGIMTGAEFDSFSQQLAAEIQLREAQAEHRYQGMPPGNTEASSVGFYNDFGGGDS